MATDAVTRQLLQLEMKYWQAIKNKDAATAARLSADPCVVVGASGVGLLDKKTLQGMMKDNRYALNDCRLEGEPQVRLLTDDVAIVAYKMHEDLTVDGKHLALEASEASTWMRQGNRWVCVLHTEAIVGDPFGRDRQRV